MISVTCEVDNRALKRELKDSLTAVGYSVVTPRQRKHRPDYRILSIKRSIAPEQIPEILKLSRRARTQFVLFTDGELSPSQLKSVFNGHTLSLHNIHDRNAAKEAIERIRDDQFLKPLLHDIQNSQGRPLSVLLQGILHSGNKGVAIIDRSFRDVYRNELHKKLAPGRPYTGRLCWQKFTHLADRLCPCINCPTHELFIMKSGEPLFRPRLVIRNVRNKVVCILLEVWPIYDLIHRETIELPPP